MSDNAGKVAEAMRLPREAGRLDLVVSGEEVWSAVRLAHRTSAHVATVVAACSPPCKRQAAVEAEAEVSARAARWLEERTHLALGRVAYH
ncbi:hypothetical protein NDU88_003500 [Pleurodeles waltl]|uniref:Uncharacterized protein n=1 Tax=Pleurodeles waltl TaxID=8319 RepID=A0AAV7QCV2_PLEWA|nr:hypothetical protein NDU88_003500 [Pleurodeles waltl]